MKRRADGADCGRSQSLGVGFGMLPTALVGRGTTFTMRVDAAAGGGMAVPKAMEVLAGRLG
eukprot:CAMPEP_0174747282 /NCGR_PEP_ID=MMETSP1094-20130205/90874_1 /TAXON_ID=156173 /ORGANISM="Chrysochromulina brevifilum, Strain UTEX LB 985" /LENGTH=60 /DNA_ID=CAMNT_0015952123 /DNA_START=253 /DNA_END=435 /DNA_ORIENTATION=+